MGRRLPLLILMGFAAVACAGDGTDGAAEEVVEAPPSPDALAPGVDSIAPPELVAAEGGALTVEPWRRTSALNLQWAFSYPSGLVSRTEGADSAAHQVFASHDGMVELRTDVDSLETTPTLETAYAERGQALLEGGAGQLRYGIIQANGFILSGRTPQGRMFAEITLFKNGLRKRLHLEYDRALELRMLPVAYRIVTSVRG